MVHPDNRHIDRKVTQEEIAAWAGLTVARVGQYIRAGDGPKTGNDGIIRVVEAGAWVREYAVRKAKLDRGGDGEVRSLKDQADAALTRKNEALARKTELEIQVREGQLIEAAAAAAVWQDIVVRVKTRMLQIPSAVAPHVTIESNQHLVQQLIDDAIRDALTELSDGVPLADVPQFG